jgi:pilus assembly protein Flp/PilA
MSKNRLRTHVSSFIADQSGATAIEYAMIASGIGVAIASIVWTLGTEIKTNLFDKVAAIF